jgi:hypothetical protein
MKNGEYIHYIQKEIDMLQHERDFASQSGEQLIIYIKVKSPDANRALFSPNIKLDSSIKTWRKILRGR